MTSFNHYALGAVADWLYRTVGGLAPAAPGYRHLAIQPRPGGGLTYARARHITPYGLAECTWTIEAEQIEVVVVVPPNATASVTLPGDNTSPIEVGAGTHRWSYPYHVKRVHHPRSLDSKVSEFLDDPEAWTTVLSTMHRYIPNLARVEVGLRSSSDIPLRQAVSMLPHADELFTALEAELAALGR
jgi:alpha-L-rhamnosidase